jgi:hypothetical protein
LQNSKYLVGIALLSVLIGTSASSSFQNVSASPNRAACATGLDNPVFDPGILDTLSDAALCLWRSGPDTTMRETCVTDLVMVKSAPIVQGTVVMDALLDAVQCLAQTDSKTTCTIDLEQLKGPDVVVGESINATSKSIICLAQMADNTSMGNLTIGNNTLGNMTGGNVTGGNTTGSISALA